MEVVIASAGIGEAPIRPSKIDDAVTKGDRGELARSAAHGLRLAWDTSYKEECEWKYLLLSSNGGVYPFLRHRTARASMRSWDG